MATTTPLSAMVLQKQGKSCTLLRPSFAKVAPRSCCHRNGTFCSIIEHRDGQSDVDGRSRPSRRGVIALFMQAALLAVPHANAQAVERGFEGQKMVEHLQTRNDLGVRVFLDLSLVPHWKSLLSLGNLAGFVLAFQGPQKNSGDSLGLIGCLVFGLLFLKEKQKSATNNASLEDVQIRIMQAERKLFSQTRSSVSYKLEDSQLMKDRREISQNGALQHQLLNAKLSLAEKGKQLGMKKDLSDALREQAAHLASSIKELERSCFSLFDEVDKQLNLWRELDAELQRLVVDLQCKDNEICILKASMENQEEANKEMVEKLGMVESSLKNYDKHVFNAEKNIENLRNILAVTDGAAELSSKELDFTGNRNESLEREANKLFRHLQSERASFEVQLAKHRELISLRGEEVEARLLELSSEQDELEKKLRLANQLMDERDELMMTVSVKNTTFAQFKELLDVNQERQRTGQNELAALWEQLSYERACCSSLESEFENNRVVGPLSQVSLEVNNQIKTLKDLTEKLELELHIASQALGDSKGEISSLQHTMESLLSSQAQLQKDVVRLNEERQAVGQALKKEKRAAAYARKQFASGKEIMSEKSQVLEELHNDLEKARELNHDVQEQILAKASELERLIERVSCITDDAFQSNSALHKEQGVKLNSGGSDKDFMSVGKRIHRNTTKQATAKTQKSPKDFSVQPSQHT